MRLSSARNAVLTGLFIRCTLVLYHSYVAPLRQSSDAFGYLRKARELSDSHNASIFSVIESGIGILPYIGSLVYDLTEDAAIPLGLMMSALGAGIIYLAYRSALELWGNEKAARMVAWGVAIFPQLVLHSALFLKEIPVAFCLTAAVLCVIRYAKHNRINHLVGYFCWISVAALFHSAMIVALPALIIGMLILRPRGERGKLSFYVTNVMAGLVLGGILHIANERSIGLDKFGGSLEGSLGTFEQREMRDTAGSAGYPQWVRIRGGLSDTWKIPVRLVALLFSPLLPFWVRSPGHLLGAIDGVLYLYLCWNIYKNWPFVKQNQAALILLFVMLALYLLFSMGVSNFGTAIRHRAKMSPLLLIVAAGLPELYRQSRMSWLLQRV